MTPEQEEEVRRALADADRADRVSIPPEVAARMDAVLADLVASRPAQAGTTTGNTGSHPAHDELAARRRRRWPRVLVAAAVLCLVALGGPAVLRTVNPGGAGSASTESAGGGGSTDTESAGSAQDSTAAPGPAPSVGPGQALAGDALRAPGLRRATLARDVQRVVRARAAYLEPDGARGTPSDGSGERSATGTCATPALPAGAEVLAVRLDGRPATLVLAAPRNGTREAAVYACDDVSAPIATTRVRAP